MHASIETALEAVPFATLVCDTTGAIRYLNPAARSLTAGQAGPKIGLGVIDVLWKAMGVPADELESTMGHSLYNGSTTAAVVQPAEGRFEDDRFYRVHVRPFEDDGSPWRMVLVEPLMGERLVEGQLRKFDDFLRTVRSIQHDINNLLMGLLGHTELLHLDTALDEAARRKVSQILHEGRRVQEQLRMLGTATRNQ